MSKSSIVIFLMENTKVDTEDVFRRLNAYIQKAKMQCVAGQYLFLWAPGHTKFPFGGWIKCSLSRIYILWGWGRGNTLSPRTWKLWQNECRDTSRSAGMTSVYGKSNTYLWWHFCPSLHKASPEHAVGLPPSQELWTNIQKQTKNTCIHRFTIFHLPDN